MPKMAHIQAQLEQAGRGSVISNKVETPSLAKSKNSSGRIGKIHLGAYLSPEYKRSLRLVQAQTGSDIQALIAQALNELFRAYNVPVVDGL